MKKWIIEKETMRELENQKVLFEFDGKTEAVSYTHLTLPTNSRV